MTHDELTHFIERGNYINKKFEKDLKFMSRGIKNGGKFFTLVLKYYHNINKYVSDVELENLRLVKENQKLKNDYIDTSNQLISGLYNRLKFLNKKNMTLEKYTVRSISRHLTKEWCLKKHYAKRMPMAVEYPFGLFYNNILSGVAIFGPTAPPVPITIFGELKKHKVRELTRLVINENLDKNILSYFLSRCLNLLPRPMCLVSFADSGSGHHGYIYQATNWIYTGEGGNSKIHILNNIETHSLTIADNAIKENISISEYIKKHKVIIEKAKPKFRYLYFLGSKTDKKIMKNDLKLKVLSYPKGDNKRYDASYNPLIQTELF